MTDERIEEAENNFDRIDIVLSWVPQQYRSDARKAAVDLLAALREAQERAENAQAALQEQYDLTAEAIRRGEKLEAENERMRGQIEFALPGRLGRLPVHESEVVMTDPERIEECEAREAALAPADKAKP